MPTECTTDSFGFSRLEGRRVVAGFDPGEVTSDASALLLATTDHPLHGHQEGRFDRASGSRCWRISPPSTSRIGCSLRKPNPRSGGANPLHCGPGAFAGAGD